MSLPSEIAFQDQQRAWMAETVRRFAVALTYVSDDGECACCKATGQNRADRRASGRRLKGSERFGYTTGLHGLGHPEVVVFGLDRAPTERLLNDVAHRVMHGANLVPGEVFTVESVGLTCTVEDMPRPAKIVVMANDFYGMGPGRSVPALRLRCAPRR